MRKKVQHSSGCDRPLHPGSQGRHPRQNRQLPVAANVAAQAPDLGGDEEQILFPEALLDPRVCGDVPEPEADLGPRQGGTRKQENRAELRPMRQVAQFRLEADPAPQVGARVKGQG